MTMLKLANTQQGPLSIQGEPATRQDVPTSFTDVVSSAWDMTQKNYKTFSKSNLINDLEEERREIYKEIENADFPEFEDENLSDVQKNFATGQFTTLDYFENNISSKEKARDDFVLQKRSEDPEKYKNLLTSKEIHEEARKRARESVEEHESTLKNATATSGTLGTFIGSAGASMTDIVNITTMPFGAVRGAGVLKTFAQEAVIQGAVETGIQVPVSQWQKEVGNEYGLGEAATNILGAGLIGGGIAGTVRAAGKAIEKGSVLFGLNQNNPKLGKEQRIASNELSKVSAIDEGNPSNKFEADISQKHYDSVDSVNSHIRANKNLFNADLKVSDKDFDLLNPEFKFDTDLQYRAGLQYLPRFQKSVFYNVNDINLKYSNGTADRFTNFIKTNKLSQAALIPTGKKFKTKKDGQAFIKGLVKEEQDKFPNLRGRIKTEMAIEKVGNDFEIMAFERNIGLKKDADDVILNYKSKKEAMQNAEGSEYAIKTKDGYSLVQGDDAKILSKTDVNSVKFYDELKKEQKDFPLDKSLKVDEGLAPSTLEPLPEPQKNAELETQINALKESDNLDARLSDLDTLVDENPNFKVELDDDTSITAKALKKELDEEKSILEQMKVCAL